MSSTVTAKGQATIPVEIREQLQLKPGARLQWFVDVHGRMVVLPERPLESLRGILKGYKPVNTADPEEIAAQAAVERDRRSKRRK